MRLNTNKKKTGTNRKDREKGKLAKFDAKRAGRPPQSASSIKKHVMALLSDYGLSHPSDILMVDVLCKELELYHKCMQEVDASGVVLEVENGSQVINQINPSYKAAKIALDNSLKLAKDFGLTTKSRLLMASHFLEAEHNDDDPAGEGIGGPGF